MRHITYEPKGPLTIAEGPRPEPGPGEILIRVAAAGVNRPDLLQRFGGYPPPPGASAILGLEVAGEVVGLGAGVTRWKAGDQVTALIAGGGYAEYATAPEGSALRVPKGLSLVEAAGLPETFFTVWANVFEGGRLKAGETILVHGGASGIGTTAIQMAKTAGARVFVTAGDAAKCALCEKLGADRAINYRTEDFEAVMQAEGGADVVLDMVGAPYVQKNLNLLKEEGRAVIIAFLQGSRVELDLMNLMRRRLTLTGSTLRPRSTAEKARIASEVERVVWPWVEAGKVRPLIDSTFPLEEADAAHARLNSGSHAGKVILRVSGE